MLPEPLSVEALRWQCKPGDSLATVNEELSKETFIGQERAQRALSFGLRMRSPEFNIYVAGPPGTGKFTMSNSFCRRVAEENPVPYSVVYVHNFSDPDKPTWLKFPPGVERAFQEDMSAFIAELQDAIPKAFEDEAHEEKRKEIIEQAQERQREKLSELQEKAKEAGFTIQLTPTGMNVIPLIDGEAATQETFEKLPQEEKERLEKSRMDLGEHISEFVKETRALEKEIRGLVREFEKDIALTAVKGPVEDLREKYKEYEKVLSYLDSVEGHILENLSNFRTSEDESGGGGFPMGLMMRQPREENPFRVYEVNVVVDNSDLSASPVVFESNPNFNNLFGRIERRVHFGTYTTDFTMIRAGAMIHANGGFLILNALDVLMNLGVWPALKRAIRDRCVRIEDLGESYGWTQGTIKPEPVPVDAKVILMGNPMLYYLLLRHDEDFGKLFKVKADFNYEIKRTPESMREFRAFIDFHRKKDDLLPFAEEAVGRVLEMCSRLVSDQDKLSAQFGEIRELLLEADHWAKQEKATQVEAKHVVQAEEERRFRANLLDERLREEIIEGNLMIDVTGAVVGQVNGLAVLSLGDYSFGKPSRITAQTFMGNAGVVNIERESKLSGSIHDKGVLILQGYLGATYAREHPLSLSASICFEQNYSGVDGDSASSTELYAILSSLSELPIKQGFSVTGSVNQRGEIQPIGGVNEKIEGFFEVCREKGALNGEQGVLIPHQNVKNLMLRGEVIEAVEAGKFWIYPIRTVDEGIAVLTGVPAGERDPETGEFPPDTVHGKVQEKLKAMFENLRRLRRRREKDDNDDENESENKPSGDDKPPSPPEPPPPPRRR